MSSKIILLCHYDAEEAMLFLVLDLNFRFIDYANSLINN
jgi:hypothetical protein